MSQVSHVKVTSLTFALSNGPGVVVDGGTNVTLSNLTVHDVGMMAINVTDNQDAQVHNCTIFATGGGGIVLNGKLPNSNHKWHVPLERMRVLVLIEAFSTFTVEIVCQSP
eukprot:TRINITY_DN10640_c0_g2_i1.p2 TRINITY_DN10640_c0_g2~~TRINITY_DN10640_c0_g2_i1.p2  ORF type:complete len:110 (-),score=23.74 TRINITY_DN10640_c0_g2_i1:415-744(-)